MPSCPFSFLDVASHYDQAGHSTRTCELLSQLRGKKHLLGWPLLHILEWPWLETETRAHPRRAARLSAALQPPQIARAPDRCSRVR